MLIVSARVILVDVWGLLSVPGVFALGDGPNITEKSRGQSIWGKVLFYGEMRENTGLNGTDILYRKMLLFLPQNLLILDIFNNVCYNG